MSSRISSLALLLVLAACGRQEARQQQQQAQAEAKREAALPKFLCATGSGPLRRECDAERMETDTGWIVILRHPDGHFRRLLVNDRGHITPADGAEKAQVTPGTGGVAIAVGDDRYLLPVEK